MNKKILYTRWASMKQRCLNPNNANWKEYGGRGIRVCERWMKYENFYNDMIDGFKPGLTIDRIDNGGNHTPENCRWVTLKKNCMNRRSNRKYEHKGNMMTIRELSQLYDLSYSTLHSRLIRSKWALEKALNQVPMPGGHY